MRLDDSVDVLKGVGPKKKDALEAAGIKTVEDLIMFFPKTYEDRRTVSRIDQIVPGEKVLVEAEVVNKRWAGVHCRPPFFVTVSDGTGVLNLVFFNGRYIQNMLRQGERYVFFGQVEAGCGKLEMVHPDFSVVGSPEDIRAVVPVYPSIKGIYPKEMLRWQLEINKNTSPKEWMPKGLLEEYKIADLDYSLRNIHFPVSGRQVLAAKYRFIFEEFLVLETGILYMKKRGETGRSSDERIDPCTADEFMEGLPFQLTEGQLETWEDIKADFEKGNIMNRLIQGDVGSGKTVIAELAMFAAVRSGFQAVIMAPTEILCRQHYRSLREDFGKYGIRTGILAGSLPAAEKRETLSALRRGEIDVLTATHAVLEKNVEFKKLGMVVTDEQHRFGVNQRKILTEKGSRTDVLVMTATPIPRTLAVILYGDLAISRIHTMPQGRKPVKTKVCTEKERKTVYSFAEAEIKKGRQCYVVAPLIEESEKLDAASAEELFKELKELFPDLRVELIHGAMKNREKDEIMENFSAGCIDILVSTVIIEVGINVKNASVMVIENAERFGLSQLHQLRGRVGRGAEQSYCFLIKGKDTEIARQRLDVMEKTSDGFLIAEEDLKLRGPGELFGLRQHGLPELKVSNILKHRQVLETALKAADRILEDDRYLAEPENAGLKKKIDNMFGGDLRISL